MIDQTLAQIRAEADVVLALIRNGFEEIDVIHGPVSLKRGPVSLKLRRASFAASFVSAMNIRRRLGMAVPSEAPQERSMAEGGGFEPPVGCPTSAFQAGTLNHSATPP